MRKAFGHRLGAARFGLAIVAVASSGALLAAACSDHASTAAGDAGSDAAATDAGAPIDSGSDTGVDAALPRLRDHLSQTGLYSDFASKTIAPDLVEFAPRYVLWSDGATKRRFIRLPPGAKIDTSDMNNWHFPVGTQFFKEFSVNGVRVETRLIEHYRDTTGRIDDDYWAGAFVWRDDESDADFMVDGAQDIRSTPHDAPSQQQCWACHLGDTGHALGFSAIQLSKDGPGPTLQSIAAQGWLTNPPPSGGDYRLGWDIVTSSALGYLHANCGHCHNPNGLAWADTDMRLRLTIDDTAQADAGATAVERSTIGVPLVRFRKTGFTDRIVAGDVDASAVPYRMSQRGNPDQMPPLATEFTDDAGIATIAAWIGGL